MSQSRPVPIKEVSVGDFYNALSNININEARTLIVHEDNEEIFKAVVGEILPYAAIITHPAVHINQIFIKDYKNDLVEIVGFFDQD